MSTRIHVAAVRNVPMSELKGELRELGEFDMQEANGWVWFVASVWGVSADALLEKLEKVPRTTLLATTQDGTRWYLRLRAPGQKPYDLCHEFAMLGDGEHDYSLVDSDDEYGLEDEAEEAVFALAIPTAAPGADTDDDTYFNEDAIEEDDGEDERHDPIEEIIRDKREIFGCPLPEGVEEHLRSLPPQEAVPWLFAWESAGLIGALKRFHVPHDADEVASILLGESVTDEELESDLGSLPRLLSALGLGEYWDQTVEQLTEVEEVDDDDDEYEPDDDPIDAVLEAAEHCVALPLSGVPVEIPLEKAGAIPLLARFCDPEANAVFHAGAEYEAPSIRPAYWLAIRGDGDMGVYAAPLYGELLTGRRVRKIGKRLKELPDGATLEVVTGGEIMTSGVHRYAGPVVNGRWRIEQAGPCTNAEAIREAVTLALAVSEGAELRARDEAEAQAVIEAARTNPAFEDVPLHREGLVFDVRRAQREALGRLIFRQRFRHCWDVEEGEVEDAREVAQWQAMKKAIDESLGIPYTGRTIYEGKATRYLEVDDKQFESKLAAVVRTADDAFRAVGFEPLGALVAQSMPVTILRGYANPAEKTYAVLYPQSHGESWTDLYSRFEGGVSLTTSTMPGQFSNRRRGIYHRTASAHDPAAVLAEHRRGLAILAAKDLVLEPTPPTLEGLARALDDCLLRQLPA